MILDKIDLTKKISRQDYSRELVFQHEELGYLGHKVYEKNRPVVIMFEGWDASGKGGAIKRLTEGLDPRGYVVWPIGVPEGEDKVHHYLYRFWRRLPSKGQIAVFDRSWYGRVLVERVERLTPELDWKRAYGEINYFEKQLLDFGVILIKFWLHISREEQFRRFKEREHIRFKNWKITDDDWRNRSKWDDYTAAIEEMFRKTNSAAAPWTIVEANDKPFARIKVLKAVTSVLRKEL